MAAIRFDFDEQARAFRLVVDDVERCMPMLDGEDFRGWHARHARLYLELQSNAADSRTFDDWLRTERIADEQLVDAVLAYDWTGILGTRAQVEDTFTVEQLILMARRIARAHG